ncbi:DUF805 domain-containing protein [Candidatus Saccharibacteria bacterium]|nr:DUF805 domain-containing protein [Candidatus Saccharibacteria bacterium]
MNPFRNSLDRSGFLLWSVMDLALLALGGLVIDLTKNTWSDGQLLAFKVIYFIPWFVLGALIVMRRLQNAGLSLWLSLLWLIPVVGFLFWLALFFIPPKHHEA